MGVPKPVSDVLFLQQAKIYLDETHDAIGREERYFKIQVFFRHLANNLVHLHSVKYERFKQTLRDKLLEWSTGNEYEQQIVNDYGWIIEEL
jgi:hypothetical protein